MGAAPSMQKTRRRRAVSCAVLSPVRPAGDNLVARRELGIVAHDLRTQSARPQAAPCPPCRPRGLRCRRAHGVDGVRGLLRRARAVREFRGAQQRVKVAAAPPLKLLAGLSRDTAAFAGITAGGSASEPLVACELSRDAKFHIRVKAAGAHHETRALLHRVGYDEVAQPATRVHAARHVNALKLPKRCQSRGIAMEELQVCRHSARAPLHTCPRLRQPLADNIHQRHTDSVAIRERQMLSKETSATANVDDAERPTPPLWVDAEQRSDLLPHDKQLRTLLHIPEGAFVAGVQQRNCGARAIGISEEWWRDGGSRPPAGRLFGCTVGQGRAQRQGSDRVALAKPGKAIDE
eukprot:3070624-Prymnesium_polylepis.3